MYLEEEEICTNQLNAFHAKTVEKMKRLRLLKNFLRKQMEENRTLYNRQRNYSVSLWQKF